jgi:predicted PolB exonuclease-like 3'-5' exonuclease
MKQNTNFGQRGPVTDFVLGQRAVVMDIETVSLTSDEEGALHAISGQIVCMCLLLDDGDAIREIAIAGDDERQVISDFWKAITPTDILIGHNLLGFDLPFIRQRSWILGIRPSRTLDLRKYYTKDVVDTLELWTNWGNKKGAGLDAVSAALGCGSKTGNGAVVDRWWREGNFDAIKSYCREDARLAYRVFCRLTYREPRSVVFGTETLHADATAGLLKAVSSEKVGEPNVE